MSGCFLLTTPSVLTVSEGKRHSHSTTAGGVSLLKHRYGVKRKQSVSPEESRTFASPLADVAEVSCVSFLVPASSVPSAHADDVVEL